MPNPITPEQFKVNEFRRIVSQVEKLHNIWFDLAYRNRIIAEQLNIPAELPKLTSFIPPSTFKGAEFQAHILSKHLIMEETWFEEQLNNDSRVRELIIAVDMEVIDIIKGIDNHVFNATHETDGRMVLAKRMR